MGELEQKIRDIEEFHEEYLAELKIIETEQRQAISAFLESVKEKKIANLKEQMSALQNNV